MFTKCEKINQLPISAIGGEYSIPIDSHRVCVPNSIISPIVAKNARESIMYAVFDFSLVHSEFFYSFSSSGSRKVQVTLFIFDLISIEISLL